MGIIKIGNTSYKSYNVRVVGDCVVLDDRKIYLDNGDRPIQVCLKSDEDGYVVDLKSDVPVLITGNVGYVLCKNLCLWGRSDITSYGFNKFYNTTGKEEYRKYKSLMSKKQENKRLTVKCHGCFDSVVIVQNGASIEVIVDGKLDRCSSSKDVYCKGIIQKSRSLENSYISSK